jgi:N-acetylmuramoyl-L-alanine amidase
MDLLNAGLLWLALNVYFEARGESFLSQVDIANVVLNRVDSPRFPNTIQGVITQGGEQRGKCQFSWYCDGASDEPTDPKAWRIAVQAAATALSGFDETHGALFYYNPDLASPYWAHTKTVVKVSDHHILLR